MPRITVFCAAAFLLAASPVLATGYDAELDPAPFDATNRADVIGSIGNATATLDGSTLTVHGTFSNLKSPATTGSIRIGLAKGVPGDAIGTLTVEHARQGAFSGTIKLSPAQLSALKRQSLYVRIDSEKSPDGNLQGWLEESGKDHVS
ncbi:MAG: CHRD domain-containing protein [Alphaproteobacteria bacterium]|nr:CHRD domain-containing protein [Alphaproteobacteria bacterium]